MNGDIYRYADWMMRVIQQQHVLHENWISKCVLNMCKCTYYWTMRYILTPNKPSIFVVVVFTHKHTKNVSLSNDQCWACQLGDCPAWQKLWHCDFLGYCKSDKWQTLHGGTTHSPLLVHINFGDLDFQGLSVKTVLAENFMFLSSLSGNFLGLLNMSGRHE